MCGLDWLTGTALRSERGEEEVAGGVIMGVPRGDVPYTDVYTATFDAPNGGDTIAQQSCREGNNLS